MGGVIFKWGGRFFLKEFVYKKQTKQNKKHTTRKKERKGKKKKVIKKEKTAFYTLPVTNIRVLKLVLAGLL